MVLDPETNEITRFKLSLTMQMPNILVCAFCSDLFLFNVFHSNHLSVFLQFEQYMDNFKYRYDITKVRSKVEKEFMPKFRKYDGSENGTF